MKLSTPSLQRLHNDCVGEFLADAQACVANLADEGGVAAEELDPCLLAKAHLPKAVADIRRGFQAFDADSISRSNLTERTLRSVGAATVQNIYLLVRHLLGRN